MSLPRRFFPIFLLIAGTLCIISVILPVGLSFTRYYLFRPPVLLDPRGTPGIPGPFIVNVLGVATTDYSTAQNWFTSPPIVPPVVTKVKYFTLTIYRLKLFDVPVEVNGSNLKKNAIHYPGSSLPGSEGNTVIFGHSALPQFYAIGNPLTIFNPLPEVKIGDEVLINFDGITYHYVIKSTKEITPNQVEVLTQRPDRSELTLITCVPLGTYWHRFAAQAELKVETN